MSSILSLCRQSITKLGRHCLSKPQPTPNEDLLRTVTSIVKRGEVSSLAIEQLGNIANRRFHLDAAMSPDFPDLRRVSLDQGGFRQLQLLLCASQAKVDWMQSGDCRNLLNEQLCSIRTKLDTATTHWEGKLRSALSAGDSFRELTARAVLGETGTPPERVPPRSRTSRPPCVATNAVHWNDLCRMPPHEASLLMVSKARQSTTTETWEEVTILPTSAPASKGSLKFCLEDTDARRRRG